VGSNGYMMVGGTQRIYDGWWDPTDIGWLVGSNGYRMVDRTRVHTVKRVSQSKSGSVWI
jgi:hypothetical protein